MEKDIMAVSPVLPENFDGTFRFTNWADEDFVGRYGSKDYTFPAKTTSPMIMVDFTPLEIQQIRKKFAFKLAEREFGKSQVFDNLLKQERNSDGTAKLGSIFGAATYSINELAPYIQKCLEPMPVAKASVTDAPSEPMENKLSRNEEGEINSQVVDKKISLKKKALES